MKDWLLFIWHVSSYFEVRQVGCLSVIFNSLFIYFSGGKLVDPSPEIEKELKTEMEKLERQFGGAPGTDMTQFPTFKFEEPKLDPIDEQAQK